MVFFRPSRSGVVGSQPRCLLGERDVRLAAGGIVGGQRLVDDFRFRAGQLDDQLGELLDGELRRDCRGCTGPMKLVRGVHHADDAFDQVVAVAERAGLRAVAVERDVFAGEGLADEVRDDAAVEGVHPRAVGVEDAHDADVDPVHAVIVHEQRLGGPLAFVVAGPRADRVDVAAIRLALRMLGRVAIDLAGRGLQHLRLAAAGHAQHVDRPHHRRLHRLDRD